MSIEFRCTQCNKLLRTTDDTAGKHAKCPECGTVLLIPARGASAAPPAGSPFGGSRGGTPISPQRAPLGENPFATNVPPARADSDNPYQSPGGETVTHMGAPGEAIVPTRIDIGDVLSRSWTLLKDQLGNCVLATLIYYSVRFGFQFLLQMVIVALQAGGNARDLAEILSIVFGLVNMVFIMWLEIGFTIFMLKIARGQHAEFSDLFTGGRCLVPIVLASLLVGVIIFAGFVLCIIPGIILALMLLQFFYLIVDRNLAVLESLSVSREITTGNKLNLFVLGLLALPIYLLGFVACIVGLLVAVPFVDLILTVAYLTMTGQPTAEQLQPAA